MIIDQQFGKGFYGMDYYGLGAVWSWVSGESSGDVALFGWLEYAVQGRIHVAADGRSHFHAEGRLHNNAPENN